MAFSPLACKFIPAYEGNYTKNRKAWGQDKITEICIHYMAGNLSIETCGQIWQTPGRNGSSTYGIGSDGRIACYVDENDIAWCNSNWDSNVRSASIETANFSPSDSRVSDEALNSLIELVADISKRNGMGKLVKGQNLTWHKMYADTSCPGDYLLSKLDYIVEQANKINSPAKIKYRSHLQKIGWQDWKKDGEMSGTEGESRRLEAIQIDYNKPIYAKAHIQTYGWIDYGEITKDTIIGTTGEAKRLECLCLKCEGIKYRVHIEGSGWSCWTNADGISTLGSVGQSLRIEAIEIKEV